MPSIKPTFVLVPGNWHDASLYSIFLTRLQRIGYPAVAVRIPSLAAQDSLHSDCQSDINWVRRQLLMLIDYDGQDIILICHSFGGIIGGGAAYGLSKSSRLRQGNSGGVIGLICMSAFMIPEGQSVLNYVEGKMSFDIMAINQPSEGFCTVSDASKYLFHDVNSALAAELAGTLLPQAMKRLATPCPAAAWSEPDFAGRLAYLRCTKDEAVPLSLQNQMIESSEVNWTIKDFDSSHSPWASKPDETVKIIRSWAEEFVEQMGN